jgi:hypothetical protein
MLGAVDTLVDLASLKPRLQPDRDGSWHRHASVQTGEAPLGAGDHLSGAILMLAHGQHGVRVSYISRRIRLMHAVGQEQSRRRRIGPPLAEYVTTYGRVTDRRLGHSSPQHALDPYNVPLPATPGERVSLLQQKPIAKMFFERQIRRLCDTVKHAKRPDAPPVHYLEEQTSIPARWVHRLQYSAICPPLHLAICGTGCFVEIGNIVMARVRGVDGKGHSAAQHFVSPCGTKRFPPEKGLAGCYIKACHRHVSCPFPSRVPDAALVRPELAACVQ